MVAFVTSLLITIAMTGVIVVIARRRPPGTPLTWGEAFVAAIWVFTLLFLAYGVVPHQWLTWADNELNWRKDVFFDPWGTGSIFPWEGRARVVFPKEALRDIIAIAIYGVFLVGHFYGWYWWQNRGKKTAEAPELTSPYGRPLVRTATEPEKV